MIKQPRTQNAANRQTHLEQSLLELMRTTSYPRITVTDICRTASIPRRTFYHYFDSKDAVLDALIDNMIHRCSLEVMFDFFGGYDAMKASLMRNFYYWCGEGRAIMDVLLDNNLEGRLVAQAQKWLISEKANFSHPSGLSRKQLEIATMAGASSFFTILHYWRNNNYQESPEEMAEYTTWFLAEPLYRP